VLNVVKVYYPKALRTKKINNFMHCIWFLATHSC